MLYSKRGQRGLIYLRLSEHIGLDVQNTLRTASYFISVQFCRDDVKDP